MNLKLSIIKLLYHSLKCSKLSHNGTKLNLEQLAPYWFSIAHGMALIYHMTFGPKVIWLKSNEAPYIALYKA